MDTNSGFGEILETGQTTVRNVAKGAKQGAKAFAKTAAGQVAGGQTPNQNQGTNEAANSSQQQMSDDDAKQFLKDLYGKSDKKSTSLPPQNQNQNQNAVKTALGLPQKNPNEGKTAEELAKIEQLRNQLHGQYYQDLTNRKKAPEEHVTEKLEREEHEGKMTELETEKKKPGPIAVQRAQQSAEKFRGVSG
ncbi:MAG: hypothetical protein HY426_01020 [Candidatus Levybacteria bacterium]|nr:hypothetical protein [Candidatus Levybacteria bacterium]